MKIVVDSSCDLPLSYLEEHDVVVLPLRVIVDQTEYVDMYEISNEQIYAFINEGKRPQTSQVPLSKYVETFQRLAQAEESAIYLALSSELSGCYQAALLAKAQVVEDYPDFDLEIIDSRAASLGIGLLAREAVQMNEANTSKDQIVNHLHFMVEHLVSLFTVEDLNYLAQGGRLSKSGAFLGSLLNIHPLLEVIDGRLQAIDRFRGRKKVLNKIYERMANEASKVTEQTILIVHTNETELVAGIKDHIQETFHPKEVIAYPIGAVISAHTGIGTIGVFFMDQ